LFDSNAAAADSIEKLLFASPKDETVPTYSHVMLAYACLLAQLLLLFKQDQKETTNIYKHQLIQQQNCCFAEFTPESV